MTLLHLEEQNNLLRIIQDLPPERQQLIILKFVEHLSNAEIGQIMGRTEGAVKSFITGHFSHCGLRWKQVSDGDEVDSEGSYEC